MTTAHVEMLTASVKTLMVGSRQITLSIAKQLDVVPFEEVDVWGRIKIRDVNGVDLIGIHRRTGNLVRCFRRYVLSDDPENWTYDYPLIVLAGLK